MNVTTIVHAHLYRKLKEVKELFTNLTKSLRRPHKYYGVEGCDTVRGINGTDERSYEILK